MIKFFRHIRKSLLNEGKTSKYFKYAIGEIVLVVIGILIALQINNWNQGRIEQNKEQTYLANIKRDLENQLKSIKSQLEFENNIIDLMEPFLDSYYKTSKINLDATNTKNLSLVTTRQTFVRNDPTYTDLISSGNIDIIKNTEFKNKLIEFNQNLERVEKINHNNNVDLSDRIYFSEIIKLIYFYETSSPSSEELIKISNRIVSSDENKLKLINLVNFRQMLAEGSIELMQEIKGQTQELLNLMNK
jgi:hypothetical protein